MERLTAKNKHGKPIIKDWPNYMEFDIINRLADIEDILGDEYDLDRLKELVEAERKKRVIIAPDSIKTMSDINRLELKIRTKDWVSVTLRYENCAIGVAEALKQLGFILDAEDALKGEQDG